MIRPLALHLELLSDTTFSRGEGTAGVVDTEVEHDEFGMPFVGGRTVRGLLRDSWLSMGEYFPKLASAAARVLGRSQAVDESCCLRIGDAGLPLAVREIIRAAVDVKSDTKGNAKRDKALSPEQILAGFTSIRHQTAEDRSTGAPVGSTLRSSRVVLRGVVLESRLTWLDDAEPSHADLQVLALAALATRHGGLLRNRGRGHLCITLDGSLEQTRRYAKGKS
jgi:hypothetical protein